MFNLKRNNVIITVLVFMIAIAAYINAKQPMDLLDEGVQTVGTAIENEGVSEEEDFFDAYDENGNVRNKHEVTATITKKEPKNEEDKLSTVSKESYSTDDYFYKEKVEREERRKRERERLLEEVSACKESEEKKSALTRLYSYDDQIVAEDQIEELLKSKGFGEIYVQVDLSNELVDIVLLKDSVSSQDVEKIEYEVQRKSGISPGGIHVTPIKGFAD